MKRFITFLLLSFGLLLQAQTPEGINYQAVIRENAGTILANQNVGIKISILQDSITGTVVYEESFSSTTSQFGLVNLVIGHGTTISGNFAAIDWSNGAHFVEVAADETGGTNYSVLGTQQLMSVPYALFAKSAENVLNDQVDDADADPNNELQNWSNLPGIPNMLKTMQSGNQIIGASGGLEVIIVSVTFPTAFTNVPNVICTASTETGTIFDDSFNITVRQITTTGFEMIVNRVDGSTWGQNISGNWIAFEP